MTDWPFSGLRHGAYGALLVDPPWAFRTYGGDDVTPHRTEVDHYNVMSLDDIASLPVAELAARDCVLFLWAVDHLLPEAISVANAWGFKYKTRAFEWLKIKKDIKIREDGHAYGEVDLRIGMGYWTRKQTESCFLFTRGKPPRLNKDVRQIIAAPIREHSRKPDEIYNRIERLVVGPYAELFATQRWPGWSGWGNEYPAITVAEQRRHITSLINRAISLREEA